MTIVFTHPSMFDHAVPEGHPEHAGRLTAVLEGLKPLALETREAPLATRDALARVHRAGYLDLIAGLGARKREFSLDPDTFFSPGTYEAALRAAGAMVAAVDAVMAGEDDTAFCAVRPPGHHAEPDRAMGFCVFNNVAVGALHALETHGLKRAAVIDFDVHHGNGTQTIAERDARLFFASTHEWPQYPGTGRAEEHGIDGNVVNVPLPSGTSGPAWRQQMERIVLPALDAFGPDIILVSAGFDAHDADPLADLCLHSEDYAWGAKVIREIAQRHCGGRVVSTLEGGYDMDALKAASSAYVAALMAR